MAALTQAIYDTLSGDATLTNQLGTYQGNPSVLTKQPLPPGFSVEDNGPYIITTGETSSEGGPSDVKNAAGREILRDVRCYSDARLSATNVEDIAERVKELFHRVQSINIAGYSVVVAEATGPVVADEDDVLGRVVTVRWVLEEV